MNGIPNNLLAEAERIASAVGAVQDSAAEIIAEALVAAESRGREMQKEADARIADEHAECLSKNFARDCARAVQGVASAIRQ